MAVRAEQGEVADGHLALTGYVQRLDVVALDVASATLAVIPLEIELADFTGEQIPAPQHAFDLAAA
jgi:hypothetical protein